MSRCSPGRLQTAAILGIIQNRFPAVTVQSRPNSPDAVQVSPGDLLEVARFLRDEPALRFDSLMDQTGVDLAKAPGEKKGEFPYSELKVIFQLHSLTHFHHLLMKVRMPRDHAVIPSVAGIWPVAGWFEREIFDLFGITFTGHADLRRLMMPPDWTGFPLRKDYVYPTDYHAIPLRREGQHFDEGPYA